MRTYLRTWFILDAVIVGSDWLEIIWGVSGQGYARFGRASRAVRIIRMVRLLRMFRLWKTVAGLSEHLQSETSSIMAHIGKICVGIVGWSHLTGCVWYGIGAAIADEDPTNISWLTEYDVRERSLGYRYLTSLHWSLSQFTGGMDEVTPESSLERVYAIVMFLTAFVIAAWFSSVLTSSLTRLHMLASGQAQGINVLRKYLMQNGISKKLTMRVQRNAQLGISSKHIPEQQVELMMLVSTPLKVELHYEMHCPVLCSHPCFAKYQQDYSHIMRQLCHTACSCEQALLGDIIFSAGETQECVLRFDHPVLSPWVYAQRFMEYCNASEDPIMDYIRGRVLVAETLLKEALAPKYKSSRLNRPSLYEQN